MTATTRRRVVSPTELARFAPFDAGFTGGVNVAGADIDGNAMADNIIVGIGPWHRVAGEGVLIDVARRGGQGARCVLHLHALSRSQSGVSLATGMVELGSGRESIVTAPGPGMRRGSRPSVSTCTRPRRGRRPVARRRAHGAKPNEPRMTSNFLAYDEGYTDGVSLSTGWVAGAEGGAKSIVTGQLGGGGTVRVWSNGSRLDGFPAMYLESPEPSRRRTSSIARSRRSNRSPAPRGRDGRDHQHRPRRRPAGQPEWSRRRRGPEATHSPGPIRTRRRWRRSMIAALPPLPGVGVPAPLGGQ